MDLFERAKNCLYQAATFSIAGNHPWGGAAASALAYPLIMLGRMVYVFSVDFFYNTFIIALLLFLGMLQFVLDSLPLDRRNDIVVNRILGLVIGYYYVPLQLRFIIMSFIVFHALRSMLPRLILSNWKIDLEASPGLFGVISLDIVTGIATNVCMHVLRLLLG